MAPHVHDVTLEPEIYTTPRDVTFRDRLEESQEGDEVGKPDRLG